MKDYTSGGTNASPATPKSCLPPCPPGTGRRFETFEAEDYLSVGFFMPGAPRRQEHAYGVASLFFDADAADWYLHEMLALDTSRIDTVTAGTAAKQVKAWMRTLDDAELGELLDEHRVRLTEVLAWAGVTPTVITRSGYGHHVHVWLDEWAIGQVEMARTKTYTDAIVAGVKQRLGYFFLDVAANCGAPQLCRDFGYTNRKNPSKPRSVVLVGGDAAYRLPRVGTWTPPLHDVAGGEATRTHVLELHTRFTPEASAKSKSMPKSNGGGGQAEAIAYQEVDGATPVTANTGEVRSLRDWTAAVGDGKQPCHCPEHDDRTVSAVVYSWGLHCKRCGNIRPEPEPTVAGFRVFGFGAGDEGAGGTTPPKKIQEGSATAVDSPVMCGVADDDYDDSYEFDEADHDFDLDDFDDTTEPGSNDAGVSYHRVSSKRLTDAIQDALSQLPPDGGILVIRSPQETGKTHLAALVAEDLLHRYPKDCQVAPTHRVALVRDLARRLGYTPYDIDPSAQRVATTLDSIWRVPTFEAGSSGERRFSLVVLDEVSQVLRHLVGGTIGADAPKIINRLRTILASTKYIVAMDADADDNTIEALRLLAPSHRAIRVIDNQWRPTDRSAAIYESRDEHTGAFVADVKSGLRVVYFTCGGPSRAATVAKMASDAHPGAAVRIYSQDTSKLIDVQDELADINAATAKYAVLIATPTLGSGVDIQDLEFERVYLDVPAHDVGADEAVQLGFRVRNPKDRQWRVWVDCRKQHRLTDRHQIARELHDIRKQTEGVIAKVYRNSPAMMLVSGIEMAPADVLHLDLYCRAWSHIHTQTNDLGRSLRERFKEAGFTVIEKPLSDSQAAAAIRDEYKVAKEATTKARAARIVGARDIDTEEADRIKRARKATQEDLDAAEKAIIRDYYGKTPDVTLALEDNREALRPKIANLAVHLLARDKNHLAALMRDVRRVRQGLTARVKGQFISAVLLQQVLDLYGISKGTDIETYTAPLSIPKLNPDDRDTAVLFARVQRFLKVKPRPKTKTVGGKIFRIAPVDAVYFLSRVLGYFGLGLDPEEVKVNGEKVRTYRINTALAKHRIELAQASVTRLKDALKGIEDEATGTSRIVPADEDEDFGLLLGLVVELGTPGVASGGTTPP